MSLEPSLFTASIKFSLRFRAHPRALSTSNNDAPHQRDKIMEEVKQHRKEERFWIRTHDLLISNSVATAVYSLRTHKLRYFDDVTVHFPPRFPLKKIKLLLDKIFYSSRTKAIFVPKFYFPVRKNQIWVKFCFICKICFFLWPSAPLQSVYG